MRKALAALAALAVMPVTAASAADMPVKAPATPAQTVFSWTGFYIGVEGGWGESQTESTRIIANHDFLAGTEDTVDRDGAMFGFDFGANYQINWFIIGAEGDFQWTTIQGTATEFANTTTGIAAGNHALETRDTDWVDTAKGRIGVAWDRWMVYATGGGAWRRVNNDASSVTLNSAGAEVDQAVTAPSNQSGYVVGGGIAWAPVDYVSFKIEGDWYSFGTNSSSALTCVYGTSLTNSCKPGSVTVGDVSNRDTLWEIKGGIDYHFNWWLPAPAVSTRY